MRNSNLQYVNVYNTIHTLQISNKNYIVRISIQKVSIQNNIEMFKIMHYTLVP